MILTAFVALWACAIPAPPTANSPTGTAATAPAVTATLPLFSPLSTEILPLSPLATATPPVSALVTPVPPPVAPFLRSFLPLILGNPNTPTPTPQPPPPTATPLPPPVLKPGYGVQIDPNTDDLSQVLRWVQGMGFGWVKVQVQWHIIEQRPEDYHWVELDRLVNLSYDFNFKLLISVVSAPGWLRSGEGNTGPPQDPAEFGRFMRTMASRYAGKVTAYELWNEPNLSREWYGETLGAAAYVTLLEAGSMGVRQGDPLAFVISAAPAVTGIDDGVTAIDDRRFLREMLAAGAAQWVDGIGVHPYGYGNPPWERAADAVHEALAWNNHPSFFFLDTLEDYHAILQEYNITLSLWPTEFGWPATEGIRSTNLPPDFSYPYAAWITEQEQADYLIAASKLIAERPWVGPFFLWNLNTSVVWGSGRPEATFSLLRTDTAFRKAYIALRVHQP